MTGLLHDIGKIDPDVSRAIHSGVPLTTAERTVVNEHALIGFKTIYETGRNPVISLRERCGTLMSEVALNTLFSHANTRKPESSGVDEAQIAGLVEAGIITPKDALSHYKKDAVLLVTLADATDALLSTGSERAYRASRLAAEGRTFQIDPVTVSDTIRETIDLGAIDVAAFVTSALERYPEVCRAADSLSLELSRRTRRSTSKLFN